MKMNYSYFCWDPLEPSQGFRLVAIEAHNLNSPEMAELAYEKRP